MTKRGTPKSLNQAISNAFEEYKRVCGDKPSEHRLKKILKNHLLEFNRNIVQALYMAVDFPPSASRSIERLVERKR